MATYADLLAELGQKPDWLKNVSDRAALSLVRDNYTLGSLNQSVVDGMDLYQIPNLGVNQVIEVFGLLSEDAKKVHGLPRTPEDFKRLVAEKE